MPETCKNEHKLEPGIVWAPEMGARAGAAGSRPTERAVALRIIVMWRWIVAVASGGLVVHFSGVLESDWSRPSLMLLPLSVALAVGLLAER